MEKFETVSARVVLRPHILIALGIPQKKAEMFLVTKPVLRKVILVIDV